MSSSTAQSSLMTMMARSRFNNTRGASPLVTTGITVLLVLVFGILLAPFIQNAVASLTAHTQNSTELAALSRNALIERMKQAESEVVRTRYQSVLYQSVVDENSRLKAALLLEQPGSYVSARVLAIPPRTHFDTLLIGVGTDAGVVIGDEATFLGMGLGTVTSASSESSTVELYTSPGSVRDAAVGLPRSIVELKGTGGGSFETLVPGGVQVAPGDTLTDTTTGMVVAVIASIQKRDTDTAQTVFAVSPVSLPDVLVVNLLHAH